MDDLISRQAAIDALDVGAEVLRRVLDEVDVVGVERAKYEWGLGLIESYIADVNDLPSAQPEQIARDIATIIENEQDMRVILNAPSAQSEIIRCKDCMHNGSYDTDCPIDWNGKEYCSFAERKEDE